MCVGTKPRDGVVAPTVFGAVDSEPRSLVWRRHESEHDSQRAVARSQSCTFEVAIEDCFFF